MNPFNIKVRYNGQTITFTVLPEKKDHFKIIYFGAILAEIRLNHGSWGSVPIQDAGSTNLPLFQAGRQHAPEDFEWNEQMGKLVAAEIARFRAELSS